MPDDWQFILCDMNGKELADLWEASSKSVTFRLMEKCEASFTISGFSPTAAMINELQTDLFIVCNKQRLARMRITGSSQTLDGTDDTINFTAMDYRGLLERRYAQSKITWSNAQYELIGWQLIDHTQNQASGDWGIRRQGGTTIDTMDYEVPAGKNIAEAINEIGLTYPGMNWWIDATLHYNAVGFRGVMRDFRLDYGGNVTNVQRDVDAATYGNMVRFSGSDETKVAKASVTDLAARIEGRWEAQEGNTDWPLMSQLTKGATMYLQRHGSLLPSYTMTLTPGTWSPSKFWVGDMALVYVKQNRLNIDSVERAYEIAVNIGDDGSEEVSLTFGTLREDLMVMLRKMPGRLERLNRR